MGRVVGHSAPDIGIGTECDFKSVRGIGIKLRQAAANGKRAFAAVDPRRSIEIGSLYGIEIYYRKGRGRVDVHTRSGSAAGCFEALSGKIIKRNRRKPKLYGPRYAVVEGRLKNAVVGKHGIAVDLLGGHPHPVGRLRHRRSVDDDRAGVVQTGIALDVRQRRAMYRRRAIVKSIADAGRCGWLRVAAEHKIAVVNNGQRIAETEIDDAGSAVVALADDAAEGDGACIVAHHGRFGAGRRFAFYACAGRYGDVARHLGSGKCCGQEQKKQEK